MSDIVTFLDSRGRVISNDPRFHLRKMQEQEEARLANLQQQEVEATEESEEQPSEEADEAAEEEPTEDDEDKAQGDDLDELRGKELKALAAEEGVDITGLTKVSQVREAIRAHRAEVSED